jgi:hypothetical protein
MEHAVANVSSYACFPFIGEFMLATDELYLTCGQRLLGQAAKKTVIALPVQPAASALTKRL